MGARISSSMRCTSGCSMIASASDLRNGACRKLISQLMRFLGCAHASKLYQLSRETGSAAVLCSEKLKILPIFLTAELLGGNCALEHPTLL